MNHFSRFAMASLGLATLLSVPASPSATASAPVRLLGANVEVVRGKTLIALTVDRATEAPGRFSCRVPTGSWSMSRRPWPPGGSTRRPPASCGPCATPAAPTGRSAWCSICRRRPASARDGSKGALRRPPGSSMNWFRRPPPPRSWPFRPRSNSLRVMPRQASRPPTLPSRRTLLRCARPPSSSPAPRLRRPASRRSGRSPPSPFAPRRSS